MTVRCPDNELAYVCNTERTKVGYRPVFLRRGTRRGMACVLWLCCHVCWQATPAEYILFISSCVRYIKHQFCRWPAFYVIWLEKWKQALDYTNSCNQTDVLWLLLIHRCGEPADLWFRKSCLSRHHATHNNRGRFHQKLRFVFIRVLGIVVNTQWQGYTYVSFMGNSSQK